MDVEPQSAASSPIVTASQLKLSPATQTPGLRSRDDSSAATGPSSSSRSKGRGTKSRMINVGGNRLEAPSHSSRHKNESFRPSGSRRGNPTSNAEWNSLDDNQINPRNMIKIVDKELASQYNNDIGDPFLPIDSSNAAVNSPNNAQTEPDPEAMMSSEPQTNLGQEITNPAEPDPSIAIASPPGSPIAS
ncbi:hypothetical protein KEM48_005912 [Puccinia striiformis f. sp. tritici PST-130]|nr:hypothetical protein Pst134EB_018493 [Puccinia striiformis f. sp. tritici]KAI9614601.1 hypothetical protein KEM48_005912 [Puccinia striiformis f. sp. tritici PST-130]